MHTALNEASAGMCSDSAGGSAALTLWAALKRGTGGRVTRHRLRAAPPLGGFFTCRCVFNFLKAKKPLVVTKAKLRDFPFLLKVILSCHYSGSPYAEKLHMNQSDLQHGGIIP